MIPFQNFDNLEKYNEALISVFGNVEVPYFLIRNENYKVINNKYYINIDDLSEGELISFVEHGDIIYS